MPLSMEPSLWYRLKEPDLCAEEKRKKLCKKTLPRLRAMSLIGCYSALTVKTLKEIALLS